MAPKSGRRRSTGFLFKAALRGERFKADPFRPTDPQTAALASIRQNGSGRLSRVAGAALVPDTWGLLGVFYTRATPQLSLTSDVFLLSRDYVAHAERAQGEFFF